MFRRPVRSRRRPLLVAVPAVAVVVVVVAAVAWLGRPAAAANTLLTATPGQVAAARAELDRLAVGPRPAYPSDYSRRAFGDAWTDTDGNGCNQRDDVLLRDVDRSRPFRVGRQRGCDHDVLAGTWLDPYTGTTITLTDAKQREQAESVQIDHVVPLSVAWRYGADTWTADQRLAFANDLRGLLAVAGDANQAKGGSDASEWRPVTGAQCGYAVRYIGVKAAYALPTDPQERAALAGMLATCPAN